MIIVIPRYIEIKKLRSKKLLKNATTVNGIKKDLNITLKSIRSSYKKFLK